ncbi:autophagy 5 [Brachionus plicatilis]|uniref:Autophagy protein 5 n=1 Tax=Brachionus plicatilis TaxID=10195 RepID=A0A2Z4EUM0_BRAPC|nr:autophagy-related protein 5 [Brachionus plicatilis]RNA08579.1 autophagy 5 [Brachionus plicatilis]
MADDKEILKEIWDGKIPICFKLAENEWRSSEPEEIYLMVSRQSYFPLVLEKVQRHFAEYVSQTKRHNEVWLDYNGTNLKWHYPIGLLYDLYANQGPENQSNIPWALSVHFDEFPGDLLHCESKEVVESFFLSTIKEADALKHKGKIINEMQRKDHLQLWNGVKSDKFEQFWSMNKKLMEASEGEGFMSIPFRVYQLDKPFIQKLFQPFSESGKKRTLKDLLEFTFGETISSSKLILIQGIQPSMDTPIQWLSEHLSYPDNFLHICVK